MAVSISFLAGYKLAADNHYLPFFHWLSLQAIVLFYFCQSKVKIASKNI